MDEQRKQTMTRSEFLPAIQSSGEMADRVRSLDWDKTSLGGFDRWAQALRSFVETILSSRFPMSVVWGPERVFIYNDAYAPILGAKHPAALGARFAELWSEAWQQIGPILDDAFENRPSYFEDMPVALRRNGVDERAYFTFSYSPLRGDQGAIEGALCVCSETTATVRLKDRQKRENDRLRQLFEQAPGFAAIVTGQSHVFEMRNAAYASLTGGRALLGLPVAQALPEAVVRGFVGILDDVLAKSEPYIGREVRYEAVKGPGAPQTVYVDFICQPVLDAMGAPVGVFIQGHEVTEQVMAQQALLAADKQKDQFIATLAHELRNPLAPVSAAAHLLARPGVATEAGARAAAVIGRQVAQMKRLLDDLLDVARIARQQMTLQKERCKADDLISLAVEAVRPALDARRHKLSIDLGGDPVEIEADRVRIVQIISNLLANAAKYTHPGGSISIVSSRAADQWELQVRDNGRGISAPSIGRIFDMFAQETSALSRSEGGLGIGLGLAKKLAELHGGSIEARSEGANRGSAFTVRIPAIASGQAAPDLARQRSNASRPPELSILLADDNQDLVDIVKETLEARGHRVVTAADGAEGLDAFRRERPSIAVLDIGMPKLNGYELARAIRGEPGGGEVFLIAATGWSAESDKAEARSAGFDAHHEAIRHRSVADYARSRCAPIAALTPKA